MKPEKWRWMMDYCKRESLPPAQSWAWEIALDAWEESEEIYK